MLKAVLFDMDGVIVDTEPLHHKAYQMMCPHLHFELWSNGVPLNPANFMDF